MSNTYAKYDIRVFDDFIDKFAHKYIEQRSACKIPNQQEILLAAEALGSGFDLSQIKSIIERQSIYIDSKREGGETPSAVRDIYRSDLGELLTTYYFEEKLDKTERYIIPAKNLSTRERYDMPGRGIDAIGYRINTEGKPELLIAEAKVSEQKVNPPSVVDGADDSIYKSLKNYHDHPEIIQQRLSEYCKYLSGMDLAMIMFFVIEIENGSAPNIMYGCGLVRDETCVDESKDFGKMRTNAPEFDPGNIHFAIFSFTEATIESTIDLFYKRVRELTK